MRKLFTFLLAAVLLLSLLPDLTVRAATPTGAYEEMLARAEAIVNYQWVAGYRISTWNGSLYNGRNYFEEGEVVIGMPYTLFSFELGMNSLLSLQQYTYIAGDNYSTTFFCNSVGEIRTGPIYGSCCATFLSEVLGGAFMYGETPAYGGVASLLSNYTLSTRTVKADEILSGDALYDASMEHIIWVGGMTDQTITIYEQTPPVARKRTIPRSSVNAEGYLVYNGRIYTCAARSRSLEHSGDHVPVADAAKAATCTTDGFTAGSHCAICGQVLEMQKLLPAFGHDYQLVESVSCTDTKDGYIKYQCTNCGGYRTDYLPSPSCASHTFNDIPFAAWYHDNIDFIVQRGYMNGTGLATFEPDTTMSRAMLVTVLWRYEGAPEGFESSFADVNEQDGSWYYKAVAWAAANGIVNGMGGDLFEPNGTITREQLTVILHRYSQSKGISTELCAELNDFPDKACVGDWSLEAMQWAVGEKLIGGTNHTDGRIYLDPQGHATRAQVATILMRYIQNIIES